MNTTNQKGSLITRATVIFLFIFFFTLPLFASNYGPPKPPKKLVSQLHDDVQVSLTWERDQENLNQPINYLIYQKFYSSYNDYEGYNGYLGYFQPAGRPVLKERSWHDLLSVTRPRTPEQFSQAQYSDVTGFRRSKLMNQYRLIDGFSIQEINGMGAHYIYYNSYGSYGDYGSYNGYDSYHDYGGYNSYFPYFAFRSYWTYNENEVHYEITGLLPEKTDFDERKRGRGHNPVLKVVATKWGTWQPKRSLASAESPINNHPYMPPPAPEDVTVRLLDSGNVRLEWDSGFGSSGDYYHRIYQNVYDPYGMYQTYQPYRSYSNFVELATVRSNTGGKLSYEVPASRVRTGVHEYATAPPENPLGIYKVVSGYVSSGGIRDSQASPESWFAAPQLTVQGGDTQSVCVGQELTILVRGQNAFNQRPESFAALDVGGSGVDVNLFWQSAQNQSPATFEIAGTLGVFRWTPSHMVDTEIVRFVADDSYTLSYGKAQADVTIETRNC